MTELTVGTDPVQDGWGADFSITTRDGLNLAGGLLMPGQSLETPTGSFLPPTSAEETASAAALGNTARPMVVVLVHGLGEHSGRYSDVAKRLANLGMYVVGYDHRGHGRSPGKRGGLSNPNDLIDDLREVVKYVRFTIPNSSVCLLGHSLGGLVVARYVDRQIREGLSPLDVSMENAAAQMCILSSPALGLHLNALQRVLLGTLGTFLPKVTVSNGLKPKWLSTDPTVVEQYVRDPLVHGRVSGELVRFMLESIKSVQAISSRWEVPTLLVYAAHDRCVNSAGAASFAKHAPSLLLESHCQETDAHETLTEIDGEALRLVMQWLDKMRLKVIPQVEESTDCPR